MKVKYSILLLATVLIFTFSNFKIDKEIENPNFQIGQAIDSLNGVIVYYNGDISNVSGRNTTKDGYNLGLKYQCVEFVKRYYYEYFNHKTPDSYGHTKDFFDANVPDGLLNKSRNLIQYTNPSKSKPQVNDLLVLDKTKSNKYGHVAIISKVSENEIEIIQQNPDQSNKSRETYQIEKTDEKWIIKNERILGWLRKN